MAVNPPITFAIAHDSLVVNFKLRGTFVDLYFGSLEEFPYKVVNKGGDVDCVLLDDVGVDSC